MSPFKVTVPTFMFVGEGDKKLFCLTSYDLGCSDVAIPVTGN
jgi:hypothetical protein